MIKVVGAYHIYPALDVPQTYLRLSHIHTIVYESYTPKIGEAVRYFVPYLGSLTCLLFDVPICGTAVHTAVVGL